MKKRSNIVVGTLAAASLMATPAAAALAAGAPVTDANTAAATDVQQSGVLATSFVKVDAAEGQFSWSQGDITPTEKIRQVFAAAARALCGNTVDFVEDNPLQWKLSVSGDVDNEFTATVDELAQEESVQQVMSCSCGGNPADGAATITADVKGIPVSHLLSRASASNDANAITFVSADGTEVAMPLAYVVGHHAVISFEINGEDLSASVGGNNQLWLAGASANYFVRDIVEIRVTHEDVVPAKPGEGMDYPNSPNAGILSAAAE